jgi:hypothetical protein
MQKGLFAIGELAARGGSGVLWIRHRTSRLSHSCHGWRD